MPSTKPIFIPLSWVSFTSEVDFIKHSYRICPERQIRKHPTVWKPQIDPSIEFQFDCSDLNAPGRWRNPRLVFFNPNVDLFHERIPPYIIQGVFRTMVENPHHTFFLPTANTGRMAAMTRVLPWKPNMWAGARISHEINEVTQSFLVASGALNRFLLFEDVSGPIQPGLFENVGWVVSGLDSGVNWSITTKDAVFRLQEMSKSLKIPFFHKTWVYKHGIGRKTCNEAHFSALPSFFIGKPKASLINGCIAQQELGF